ncbi:MAG: hypothetical protein RR449_07850, partial [Christensenella sp.]
MKKKFAVIFTVIFIVMQLFGGTTALAWASYESRWSFLCGNVWDPVHEDITQFALAQTLQQQTVNPKSVFFIDSNNTPEQQEAQFAHILEYLRVGAYWNDFPASNVLGFAQDYLMRELVPRSFKNKANVDVGVYSGFADVGRHLQAVRENPWIGYSLVRMTHNENGGTLHSMLTLNADRKDYISQTEQKKQIMEWLEAAYKFVNDEKLSAEQEWMLKFADPYGQFDPKVKDEWEQPATQVKHNKNNYAREKISMNTAKIRTLGMLCHTLEDAYNPAHVVRMYSDAQNATLKDHKILAFGNYQRQDKDLHLSYDKLSPIDEQARAMLRSKTQTLKDVMAQDAPNISETVYNMKTMAFPLTYQMLEEFFAQYAQGKSWAELQPWIENVVYATMFASDGNSLIFDGGRKTAKLDELKSAAKLLDASMSDAYHTNGDESAKMLESFEQYQKNNAAYFKGGQPTAKYHTPFDADAYAELKQYVDFVCN